MNQLAKIFTCNLRPLNAERQHLNPAEVTSEFESAFSITDNSGTQRLSGTQVKCSGGMAISQESD
jgi:hypothetical protein